MAHKKCQYFLNTYIKGKEKIQLYNTNESCFEASEPKHRGQKGGQSSTGQHLVAGNQSAVKADLVLLKQGWSCIRNPLRG